MFLDHLQHQLKNYVTGSSTIQTKEDKEMSKNKNKSSWKAEKLAMGFLMLSQFWCKFENLSTPYFLADKLLLGFSINRRAILAMEFFHMPCHVALVRKFMATVLNWTLKEFSLVLKQMPSQVVLSSIAGMAIINWTSVQPLQQSQKYQIHVH